MFTAELSVAHHPLTAVFADLPPVGPNVGGKLRNTVIAAVRQRDSLALKSILEQSGILRVDVALRTVWLPIALGLSAWENTGNQFPDGPTIGRLLRSQTRSALLALPEQPVSRWLVPSTLHDTTTAHLAALALSLRGMGTRVWTWPLPPPGPALLVGDAGSLLATCGRIPTLSDEPGWPTLASLVA